MLYVSLRDGTVRQYDLRTPGGIGAWSEDSSAPGFGPSVRGVALGCEGPRVALPAPRRFRRPIVYLVELVRTRGGEPLAERISAVCDEVVVSLTMHLNARAGRFRLDLDRRRSLPGMARRR